MTKKDDQPIRQPKLHRHNNIEVFTTQQLQLEFFGKAIALISKNLWLLAEIGGSKSSQILKLNPFQDQSGNLCSGSWLTNIPGLTY